MKQHEKLASEESKTLKNEEFTSKNDGIKPLDLKSCIRRRSKTLIKPSNNNAENLEKISNFDEKNTDKNEEAGEYYGKRPLQMNYMSLDAKEKKILEFLDNERVEWGDPAEKTYAYYNNMKKKLIMSKKNFSVGTEKNYKNSEELDLSASPLMMRRKYKANTLTYVGNTTLLKETFSVEGLTKSENQEMKKLSPTKFKLHEIKNG